ncbi:flagellar L-ring protein precursor [bacterium BMS3Abin03]|nr:flagellar L-ring protein precursor [bacterium BMS3Abin03]HDZ58905.1 flagellar basal body L-ring protein FlgH [Ignavibacteriales bacterium]
MKKFIPIAIIIFSIASVINAQNMRQNAFASLFSDQKASRVGDAITIVVVEFSQASNNAQTTTGRSSDIALNGGGEFNGKQLPGANVSLGLSNDFKGSGVTKTSGMMRTKISATIDSVLDNGNLMIKGSRKIVINGEEQTIFIKGIVRTTDIDPNNSVLSYNISEAEIRIDGSGRIADSQSPGWLTKLFHWLF